jgi:predicted nucleotidyltransferase
MDAATVAEIDARLRGVESTENVTIPWAIESGSRAWGFPSPDSDYDGRFFFVRRSDEYLSPWPKRDVIETPLDATFDVNGWDLAKTLRLLVKGNGTVTEWLRSPIVYRGDTAFRDGLLELAESVVDRALLGRHYLHVGRHQWEAASSRSLKKVFYALRPAAILRWLARNPARNVPPMNLREVLAECEAPTDLIRETEDLIALKSVTRELGSGDISPSIARFVGDEFADAERLYEAARPTRHAEKVARCEDYFVRTVAALGG